MGDMIVSLDFTSIHNGAVYLVTLKTEKGHWYLMRSDFSMIGSTSSFKDHYKIVNMK